MRMWREEDKDEMCLWVRCGGGGGGDCGDNDVGCEGIGEVVGTKTKMCEVLFQQRCYTYLHHICYAEVCLKLLIR